MKYKKKDLLIDSFKAESLAKKYSVFIAADSQSSSQIGDISRFKGVQLITPTEREARIALQNHDDGLVVLSEKLMKKAAAAREKAERDLKRFKKMELQIKIDKLEEKLDHNIRGYDHLIDYKDDHKCSLRSDWVDENIQIIIIKHNYEVNKVKTMKIKDFKTKYKKDQKLKYSFKVLKFMSRRVVRDQTYIQANVDVIRYNL